MPTVAYFPRQLPAPSANTQEKDNLLPRNVSSESEPAVPSEEELRLRAEIEVLRTALREAQRQLQQYDVLLQNARVRERELRAQLSPHKESR